MSGLSANSRIELKIGSGSDYFSDELNGAMNMGMSMEVPEGVVQLNVGGTCFLTTTETLCKDRGALLSRLLTPEGLDEHSKVKSGRIPGDLGQISNRYKQLFRHFTKIQHFILWKMG